MTATDISFFSLLLSNTQRLLHDLGHDLTLLESAPSFYSGSCRHCGLTLFGYSLGNDYVIDGSALQNTCRKLSGAPLAQHARPVQPPH